MTDPLFASTPAEPTGGAQPGAGTDAGNAAASESPEEKRRRRLLNLRTRLFTGVPALLLLLLLINWAPIRLLRLLVVATGVYGMHEYLKLLEQSPGLRLPYKTLMAGAFVIGLGSISGSIYGLAAALFLTVVLVLLRMLLREKINGVVAAQLRVNVLKLDAALRSWLGKRSEGVAAQLRNKVDAVLRNLFKEAGDAPIELPALGTGLVGLLWIPWSLAHLNLILRPHVIEQSLLTFLVLTITLNDTFAYFVGSMFGRHPLVPRISPNKTVEGSLGGLAGGLLAAFPGWLLLGGSKQGAFPIWELMLLAIVLAALGQLGDLLESKLKRINGATASGHFLAGHGGLLDRIDSYLVAAPCLYYYLTVLRP